MAADGLDADEIIEVVDGQVLDVIDTAAAFSKAGNSLASDGRPDKPTGTQVEAEEPAADHGKDVEERLIALLEGMGYARDYLPEDELREFRDIVMDNVGDLSLAELREVGAEFQMSRQPPRSPVLNLVPDPARIPTDLTPYLMTMGAGLEEANRKRAAREPRHRSP